MTQKPNKIFINEIYSKRPKQKNNLNKTDAYHTDNNWSFDILDLKDYGPENNRNYRNVYVVNDKFSKLEWAIAIRKKIPSQKNSLSKVFL